MSATATLTRWGNGMGLLIPKSIREDAGIKLGDRVLMDAKEGCITIRRAEDEWTLHNLMEGYEGPPPEFIDYGEAYGREAW